MVDEAARIAAIAEEAGTPPPVRLNWSTLRLMATSAKLLQYRLTHPMKETAPLRMGRAIHCATLEPEKFPKVWIVATMCSATKKGDGERCGSAGKLFLDGAWYCGVKGHAPAGAGKLPAGLESISEDELVVVNSCAAAVREHPIAGPLFAGGRPECALEWVDELTGTPCKGRLDYLRPADLIDLKSTRRATTKEFINDAARSLYHAQLAWYHDGAIAARQIPEDAPLPMLVSVSTEEPYDVAPYRITRSTYMAGQTVYRGLLKKYLDCKNSDWWPGIAPTAMLDLQVPDWAPGMNGPEETLIEGDWS